MQCVRPCSWRPLRRSNIKRESLAISRPIRLGVTPDARICRSSLSSRVPPDGSNAARGGICRDGGLLLYVCMFRTHWFGLLQPNSPCRTGSREGSSLPVRQVRRFPLKKGLVWRPLSRHKSSVSSGRQSTLFAVCPPRHPAKRSDPRQREFSATLVRAATPARWLPPFQIQAQASSAKGIAFARPEHRRDQKVLP